jgi:hypothetical protein
LQLVADDDSTSTAATSVTEDDTTTPRHAEPSEASQSRSRLRWEKE